MDVPTTRYARSQDGTHIAYQVIGAGPPDLVYMSPWFSHLEIGWEEPRYASFLRRLSSFSRLILFDRRGSGLSDPVPADRPPDLETRIDDARTVMDVVGSARAFVYGSSESGAMAALFAATHPDLTTGLIIHGSSARSAWAPDYPWGETREEHEANVAAIERSWGTEEYVRQQFPIIGSDLELTRWLARLSRLAMSPGAAAVYERMIWEIDVRDALSAIHVPALILHRIQDDPEQNGYFAKHIVGSRYVQLPGREHAPFLGDQASVTDEIERFVRSVGDEEADLDRVLATVLFTDIVDSTATAAVMGDAKWRTLIEEHDSLAKGIVARYRGTFVRGTGDGMLATFDGPARAVHCAEAFVEAMKAHGVEIRAGCHTGEITYGGHDLAGLGVHVAARVATMAGPSEVWTSSTVKDLTAGSGLSFEDAGEHELKGVPDRWHLYRVVP